MKYINDANKAILTQSSYQYWL